jgi:hypothetical protein
MKDKTRVGVFECVPIDPISQRTRVGKLYPSRQFSVNISGVDQHEMVHAPCVTTLDQHVNTGA